ncbi:MAG TPA: hypothetical protein VKA36_08110 [Solirubrobacterales bacterium]|nr:hypothetical protein [Solirubrobacterales bacterium]
MKRRYVVAAAVALLSVSLAVPALGGPSNPVADVAGIKGQVKKAKKKAKKAQRNASKALKRGREAKSAAGEAQVAADQAGGTANGNAQYLNQNLECPAGHTLMGGYCLENQLRPAEQWADAMATCRAVGGLLPSVDALYHYHLKVLGQVGTGGNPTEWSSGRFSSTEAEMVQFNSGTGIVTGVRTTTTSTPFRCAQGPGFPP